MIRYRAGGARLVSALVAACLLTACSSSDEEAAEEAAAAWEADIRIAAGKATSEFEVAVFADNKIDAAEYEEAVQRYMACMKEALPEEFAERFTAVKDKYGMYGYNGPPVTAEQQAGWDSAYNEHDPTCRTGTIELIEPLFTGMVMNPMRLSPDEQIVDCLKRYQLVDDSYSVENLKADFGSAQGDDAEPGSFDPSKATGLDLNSGVAGRCTVTPWDRNLS